MNSDAPDSLSTAVAACVLGILFVMYVGFNFNQRIVMKYRIGPRSDGARYELSRFGRIGLICVGLTIFLWGLLNIINRH